MKNHSGSDTLGRLYPIEDFKRLQKIAEKERALNFIKRREEAKSHWPDSKVRKAILALIGQPKHRVYQAYGFPGGEFTVFRARRLSKDEKWFSQEKDLGPLSPDKATAPGRCHPPGKPLCYCSTKHEITLSELDAKLGENFVIAEFRFKKEITILPVGELDYYRRTGETYLGSAINESKKPYDNILEKPNAVLAQLIDAFIADEFIKRADTDTDYRITSTFANLVLNESEGSDQIDALIYPSVVFRGGLNFAIKSDSLKNKMELIDAEVIEIKNVFEYVIFEYRRLGKLKSNDNGLLEWTII